MFSNSNAYLGGGNSQRPDPRQYPGSSYHLGGGQQPSPMGQQQQSPFAPQPTGFGQAPLQQQYTGYPGLSGMASQQTGMPQPQQSMGQQQPPMPLQGQYTGMPSGIGQGYQPTAAPPMPSIPPQFQNQFQQQQQQQQQQPPPQPQMQISQPTGFTSAPQSTSVSAPAPAPVQRPQPTGFREMAASFQTGASKREDPKPAAKKSNKIPNIRLSFITAQDQAKFETLFKTSVGENSTTMSGEKARDLLMRSRLDGDSLSHIWYVFASVLGRIEVRHY